MRNLVGLLSIFVWQLMAYAAPQPVLQTGHGSYVYALAVSPHGDVYATGDDSGSIKIRTRAEHRELRTLSLGGRRITRLAFAPDGARLAASGDAGLAVWNLSDGRQLWKRDGGAFAWAWSGDGANIELIGAWQKRLRLDANSGAESEVKPAASPASLMGNRCGFSADGSLIASDGRSPENRTQRGVIYDAESGNLVAELQGVRGNAMRFDFSPDKSRLFTTSLDGSEDTNGRPANWGQIFDAKTGALLRSIRLFDDSDALMAYTAWSPDGKLLATVGNDAKGFVFYNGLKIWDAATGKLVRHISDETRNLSRKVPMWVSPQKLLVSVVRSEAGKAIYGVEEFDVQSGESRTFFAPQAIPLDRPLWSPDGRFLTAHSPLSNSPHPFGFRSFGTLRIWDLQSGGMAVPPWNKDSTVSVKSSELLINNAKATSISIDITPGAAVNRWTWTPDSSLLVNDDFESWQWPVGPFLQKLAARKIPQLAPDATKQQRELIVKEFQTKSSLPGGFDCSVTAMDSAPDNRTVAFGTVSARKRFSGFDEGPQGTLALWDARDNTLTLLAETVDVNWLAFSPDGKKLAAQLSRAKPGQDQRIPGYNVERDYFVEVWDVASRQRLAQKSAGRPRDLWKAPLVVGWADNRHLLIQSRKQSLDPKSGFRDSISFTHLETWDFIADVVAQFEPLRTAGEASSKPSLPLDETTTASLQNRMILVRDGKSCRWHRLSDGKEVGRVPFDMPYYAESPQISPDGKFAAVGQRDGSLELWRLSPIQNGALVATIMLLSPEKTGDAPDWLIHTPDGFCDGSPGGLSKIAWRDGGQLLPANAFAERRKPGLLRDIFKGTP